MKYVRRIALPLTVLVLGFVYLVDCSSEKIDAAVISIPELQCASCEDNIKEALTKLKGIKSVMVDAEKNVAEVHFVASNIALDEIRRKIADAGYTADGIETSPEAIANLPDCCRPPGHE